MVFAPFLIECKTYIKSNLIKSIFSTLSISLKYSYNSTLTNFPLNQSVGFIGKYLYGLDSQQRFQCTFK